MRKIILCSRYFVFGVFILCNAIISSVAIWSFSIGQSVGLNLPVDIFLAVIGALGLLFIFLIGFVEILHLDSIACRVWFECLWIGSFAILESSGAVAVTSISPDVLCSPAIVAILGNSCSSTRILMAFCWTCSICLLSYFFLLLLTSLARAGRDAQIWHCRVRRYPDASPQCLHNDSSSPIYNNAAILAPRPRRAVPAAMYAYRSGLSSQYDIEHFQPPTSFGVSPESQAPHVASSRHSASLAHPAMSFYPQHMQNILMIPSLTRPRRISELPPLDPSPPNQRVLDWLRTSTLPSRTDRESTHLPTVEYSSVRTHPRPKPTGPRSRSKPHDWRRLEPTLDPEKSTVQVC